MSIHASPDYPPIDSTRDVSDSHTLDPAHCEVVDLLGLDPGHPPGRARMSRASWSLVEAVLGWGTRACPCGECAR